MRSVLVAILLASVVLAGCSSNPAKNGTSGASAMPALPVEPNTTYHLGSVEGQAQSLSSADLTGNNAPVAALGGYTWIHAVTFEPSLGITKSGAIFMTSLRGEGPLGAIQNTHVLRGTDHASAWTDVGPFATPLLPYSNVPNSNDPFLYVDPWTSRVIDFDMCGTLSAFCESTSDDDGRTWTLHSIVTGEQTALDHQSIAASPAGETGLTTIGYPNVLVFCVNRGVSGNLVGGSYCSTSIDGGITFTPLVPGFPIGTSQCSGLSAHVKGSGDGRFYRGNPSCSGPAVYRSDDGGLTWSEHTISTTTGNLDHEVAVAVDGGNNVHAFWIGADGLPYLASSRDHGDSWGPVRMVAVPGVNETGFPAITAGGAGRIAFAYIGAHVEGGYAKDQKGANWTGYIGVMTDAFADQPLITTVAINTPDDPLSTGQCGDTRCGGFGDFIDIAVDPEGRPWAAFAHNGHDGGAGIVGTLLLGPSLLGDVAPLSPITLAGPASFG